MSVAKKLFSSAKSLLLKLFVRDRSQPEKKPDPVVVSNRQPGLDCPRCNFRMTIAIPMLLSAQPVVCPSCLLKLHVDREKSHACLQKLTELQRAFDKVEAAKKQTF